MKWPWQNPHELRRGSLAPQTLQLQLTLVSLPRSHLQRTTLTKHSCITHQQRSHAARRCAQADALPHGSGVQSPFVSLRKMLRVLAEGPGQAVLQKSALHLAPGWQPMGTIWGPTGH